MKAISAFILANLLTAATTWASDFQSGRWVGEEDWNREVCRIKTHVEDGFSLVAQQDWQGNFWIGIHSRRLDMDTEYTPVGAVAFDSDPPMLLEGSVPDSSMILFEARNSDELRDRFIRRYNLRLSFDDWWIVVGLQGSSRAAAMLADCAERVWPGAGDEEDIPDDGEFHLPFAVPSAFDLPTTPFIGHCRMNSCSWGRIVDVIEDEAIAGGRMVKVAAVGGDSEHANSEYPERYDPELDISWGSGASEISFVCSRTTPTFVSGGDVVVLDLRDPIPPTYAALNWYVHVCHNAQSNAWLDEAWLTARGY